MKYGLPCQDPDVGAPNKVPAAKPAPTVLYLCRAGHVLTWARHRGRRKLCGAKPCPHRVTAYRDQHLLAAYAIGGPAAVLDGTVDDDGDT